MNKAQLKTRVAELYERAAAGDADAIIELDELVCSMPESRKIYVDYVWLHSQLPFSTTLNQNAELSPMVAASQIKSKSIGLPASPWRLVAVVGSLVAALLIFMGLYFPAANNHLAVSGQTNPEVEGPGNAKLSNSTSTVPPAALVKQQVADVAPVPFTNNVAHPANKGKVSGGVEIDESIPEKISYNKHVRGILSENCYFCHGPDPNHREADLRLDLAQGAQYVIDVDDPQSSELIARILEKDPDLQMPPPESGRSITDRQRKILTRWIRQGAEYEPHWAFIAPTRPKVPGVEDAAWPRNAIDRFILSTLESRGISPSVRAQPQVIVRRMHLDLIGIPPTPAEVTSFCQSYQADAEAAIDELADRLLSSPHYGERMALPWLDAARYSDSNGFQQDGDRHQWPWRDWVVKALNDNMPFDQFTIEQLAGDLLPDATEQQLIATGFNRNHMLNGEGGAIAEEQRNNYVFDRVDTTATTWLGLTMACSQCHDHKYDPITQKDYYQFFAYFNNVDEEGGVDRRTGRLQCAKPFIELRTDRQEQQIDEINNQIEPVQKELADLDEEILKAMRQWEKVAIKDIPEDINRDDLRILRLPQDERNDYESNKLKNYYLLNFAQEPWKKIRQSLNTLEEEKTNILSGVTTVMIMRERKDPRKTHLFQRGEYENVGYEVQRGVPKFLPPTQDSEVKDRLALAKWLVDSSNPLTSRVTVNRYWQTFFGMGLVKTSEDFGVQGEQPSHADLLDWLAVDFREHGWDVKRIHGMIVTSETYLQSSRFRQDLQERDPENRLLARSPRFRLPSMIIRDAALTVSGLLNAKVGGKPVYPYQPNGLWKEFSLEKFSYSPSTGDDLYRRSLYTFWRRTVAPPNLFDSANRQTCSVKSSRTNTPLQALTLLNDPTFVEASRSLAEKLLADNSIEDDRGRMMASFEIAMGRTPTEIEIKALMSAIEDSRTFYQQNVEDAKKLISIGDSKSNFDNDQQIIDLATLTSVMQIVLNADEFMTRE